MAFIEFILITILVIYIIGVVGRIALRYWLRKKQQEFAQRFGSNPFGAGQYSSASSGSRQQKKREGEVEVRQTSPQQKKVSKSVGDYVEYEEVSADE